MVALLPLAKTPFVALSVDTDWFTTNVIAPSELLFAAKPENPLRMAPQSSAVKLIASPAASVIATIPVPLLPTARLLRTAAFTVPAAAGLTRMPLLPLFSMTVRFTEIFPVSTKMPCGDVVGDARLVDKHLIRSAGDENAAGTIRAHGRVGDVDGSAAADLNTIGAEVVDFAILDMHLLCRGHDDPVVAALTVD
jgi:hypothetical protein